MSVKAFFIPEGVASKRALYLSTRVYNVLPPPSKFCLTTADELFVSFLATAAV